ncbi:MAG: RNA-dependent RNA polymerase [Sanya narnavirus 4]|nr:MAG: RNA-dependent RNA polymerase [Sanya narnavirus 4]
MSLADDRVNVYRELGLPTFEGETRSLFEDRLKSLENDLNGWSKFTGISQTSTPSLSAVRWLGRIFLKDKRVFKWKVLSEDKRAQLIKAYYWDLKPDVLAKLARADWDRLSSIMNTVEAFNDNLYLCNIDRLVKTRHTPQFWRMQHWIISTEVHRPGAAIEDIKRFTTLVKHRSIQSHSPLPPSPKVLPGFAGNRCVPEELPPFWCHLCPWLRLVWKRGSVLKSEQTRVMHLVGNRGYPPPNKHVRNKSLIEHAELLTSDPPKEDPLRESLLYEHAFHIGQYIHDLKEKQGKTPNVAHLSLTNSASMDKPVKEGGRAFEVAEKFRKWRDRIPDSDFQARTWFGVDFHLKAGIPVWKTACYPQGRPFYLDFAEDEKFLERTDEDVEPGESSILMDPKNIEAMFAGPDRKPEDPPYRHSDPIFGLDKFTGYQLLQWSIDEGISEGCLSGSPYENKDDPLRLTTKRPRIRCASIGEPGWKSRVVTIGEDWLTIFLQPFSHQMRAELEIHPSARVGLSRGWQMFEYIKTCGWKNQYSDPEDRFYLSSDLKTATDYCRHDFSLALLKGFMDGIRASTHYNVLAAELLCSPREYLSTICGSTFFGRETTRGILMGDPGAKIVLTLHNLVAESIAFVSLRQSRNFHTVSSVYLDEWKLPTSWRHFVCTGDDHFAHGPKAYLQEITRAHELNGMCVSKEKNYLSKTGGFYAEEAFLLHEDFDPKTFYNCKKPLARMCYFSHPHVDALKVRLFSPVSKECDGKDEPNPAIGRAQTLSGMLAWWDGGFSRFRKYASLRWEARLNAYLPEKDYLRYLPIILGGIGAPALHVSYSRLLSAMLEAPLKLRKAWIGSIEDEIDPVIKRCLATFATNARSRGIERNDIEEQIKESLLMAVAVDIRDIDQLRPQTLTDEEWNNLRLRDKIRLAKPADLVDLRTAIQIIDRPYTFRDMLYPEKSRKHGIDPYRRRNYVKLPWSKRERMFLKNIQESTLLDSLNYPVEKSFNALEHIVDNVIKGVDPRVKEKKLIFIPRSVVSGDDLCTLQVPAIVEACPLQTMAVCVPGASTPGPHTEAQTPV